MLGQNNEVYTVAHLIPTISTSRFLIERERMVERLWDIKDVSSLIPLITRQLFSK